MHALAELLAHVSSDANGIQAFYIAISRPDTPWTEPQLRMVVAAGVDLSLNELPELRPEFCRDQREFESWRSAAKTKLTANELINLYT